MRIKTNRAWFDVRNYQPGVERKARKMKQDNERINVTYSVASLDELPDELHKHAKKSNSDEDVVYYVTVKIGNGCVWFNAAGEPMSRPANTDLDDGTWTVVADVTNLSGNPAKMEACGLWANALQIRKNNRYEFSPMTDDDEEEESLDF